MRAGNACTFYTCGNSQECGYIWGNSQECRYTCGNSISQECSYIWGNGEECRCLASKFDLQSSMSSMRATIFLNSMFLSKTSNMVSHLTTPKPWTWAPPTLSMLVGRYSWCSYWSYVLHSLSLMSNGHHPI